MFHTVSNALGRELAAMFLEINQQRDCCYVERDQVSAATAVFLNTNQQQAFCYIPRDQSATSRELTAMFLETKSEQIACYVERDQVSAGSLLCCETKYIWGNLKYSEVGLLTFNHI